MTDFADLLLDCVQDLHVGKACLAARLPAIAAAARDIDLRALLDGEAARAAAQRKRLATTGLDLEGPPNLWMAGILDDAERDTRTQPPGPLLDTALVGAIRKALAASIVSSDTAVAVARGLDHPALAPLAANRAEEVETDQSLAERLQRLVPGAA